ncbi:pentatricopeptide repeat-containing protein At1g50270 [Salvia miltiorrhiza]|uniref:pentatricopeptide repeat-containing protein At1g50270 n=1 Tax=Salvia miltiorrhiza TaxID=226208 RepID=UPI0025AD8777|nr:pentatricopeptide repeat-containing protein At1g50270 [Salvia miltiorrhiza]
MLTTPNFKNLDLAVRFLSQKFHLRANNSSPELFKLQQIHSLLIVSGFSDESSLVSTLLLHCISLPSFPRAYALSIFNQIRRRNVYTYNALIRAFTSDQNTAILIYAKMRREGVFPNKHTFPLLLKSKTHIPFQIFAHSIKFGFGSDHFLCNTLLSVCANGGLIECACKVFDEMPYRDAVVYTALMDGYVRTGGAGKALELFLQMRSSGVEADEVAVVSALSAAGMLGRVWLGRWIHGFYVEPGRVVRDVYVSTAIVNMYLKCGCCEDAMRAFLDMPHRNSVSWNALLSGLLQLGKFKDVLLLFDAMLLEKVEPSEATLATALTACAHLGSLDKGTWLDNYIGKRKLELSSVLGTALIDMYAKCGCVKEAFRVFEMVRAKGVYPWTAMIHGVAMNGDGVGTLSLFAKMLSSGVKPNEVTLIAVLSGCAHGGLVREGREVFAAMERCYGVRPGVDHYGCMVDLLGRAGRLREAVELMEGMPVPVAENGGVWGALLGACVIHGDLEVGRCVGNRVIEMQPHRSGRYSVLANLYAKCGDREAAAGVRKRMKEGGVEKSRGCSWIESNGEVHEFVAFDTSHVAAQAVYNTLDMLAAHLCGEDQLVLSPLCKNASNIFSYSKLN